MITTHRMTATVVVALALGTSAAAASARPIDITPTGSEVPAGSASVQASTRATRPVSPVSTPATIVRVTAHNTGFDWADAGIGAAGGLAVSMVGLGGALTVSQRRGRRHSGPNALTS